MNYALTLSSAQTARAITKPIPTLAHSGSIVSTGNGILRNIKSSKISEYNRFA